LDSKHLGTAIDKHHSDGSLDEDQQILVNIGENIKNIEKSFKQGKIFSLFFIKKKLKIIIL